MQQYIMNSMIGPLYIVEDHDAIIEISFENHHPDLPHSSNAIIEQCVNELTKYFNGSLKEFHVPIRLNGTNFRQSVWNALLSIPYGSTITYQDLANMIGNPKASRAVGNANHHNPIAIIVPCHRVIGRNGRLVGYAGGLEVNQNLLDLEKNAK